LILGSFWIVTLGCAFYFGFVSRDPMPPEYQELLFEQIIEEAEERKRMERERELSGIPGGIIRESTIYEQTGGIQLDFQNIEIDTKNKEPLTGERIREILAPALVSNDLVGRNAVIADMLSRLTPENALDALDVFENTPSSYHTNNNYRLFLHAWAKVDGASALAYIMDNPKAHRVEGGQTWAMSGWTASDPQAAYEFVTSREKVDHGLYHGLVRGWGRIDLEGAHEFVSTIKDKHLRGRMTDVVGESVLERRGTQGALEWLGQLDQKDGFTQAAYNSVVGRSISRSSNSLAEWISRNPDNKNIQPWMFRETAKKIASRDPGLAASWLESNLGNKSVNGEVVGQVASTWVERDPVAAAKWVDSLKGTKVYNKELAKKLAGTWARKDSAAAFEWAQTLDPKLWVPTSASIVGNLPKEELAQNAQWIKESSTDGRHDGVRAAYAMRMADEDPYSAIEQALLMKDTLGREKVTVHIAKKIYKENPKRIREWLPQSGLSEASQQRILRNQ
jgi:hypothetical protein